MNSETPIVRLEVAADGERDGKRATDDAAELFSDLSKYLPRGALPTEEEEGAKGDPVTLLSLGVVLVSTGAVTELIRCVRDWIKRRPQRRTLVIRDATGNEVVSLDAENVDEPALVEALKAALPSAEG